MTTKPEENRPRATQVLHQGRPGAWDQCWGMGSPARTLEAATTNVIEI